MSIELPSAQKIALLNQVQKNINTIQVEQIVTLLKKYSNLSKDDFRPPVLTEELYNSLLEQLHDPVEKAAWCEISSMPCEKLADLSALEEKINNYIHQYQMVEDSHVKEAQIKLNQVKDKILLIIEQQRIAKAAAQEQAAWDILIKDNYSALINYLHLYPESIHKDEIDDYLWQCVLNNVSIAMVSRYRDDMPEGRHASEAQETSDNYVVWDEVKRKGDILAIKAYMDNNPTSAFFKEARTKFYIMKDDLLHDMKVNTSEYDMDRLEPLLKSGIFTKEELMDSGLVTERSWNVLTEFDRNSLPMLNQIPNPYISAPNGCTDIFLFGTPSTGKTCLLMGLAGTNGNGYSLNLCGGDGGQYISDLTLYARNGITPTSTFGSFVTVINGIISEETKHGGVVDHKINLVEMSGEEFALRIAQNEKNEICFENMGTGATNLLKNDNRKVFFIIVDPTKLMIRFKYLDPVYDNDGNKIDEVIRQQYISQDLILNKLTSLFTDPHNQKIMEKVDAIHFIVTKADTLSDLRSNREQIAHDKLLADYLGAVTQLKKYVSGTKRINASTGFKVQVYTFSLGRFYLGNVFELDTTDTVKFIETVRSVTRGHKAETWWDRLKATLN